ncbi:MAG: hypothetical protein J0M18_12305 [Ignavibacteria bacterium]|nr:hypothetical protein [Ignavibacteria bacterium]
MNLLITKILPENLLTNEHYSFNPKALSKIERFKNVRLILLKAPKGSGKTTLISSFARNSLIKFSYYKLDEEDKNLYVFFEYLIHSIDNVLPGFKNEINSLLRYYKGKFNAHEIKSESEILEFSKTLINHIYSNINEHYYIIIDNFEFISELHWGKSFFDYFIENCPNNIHFIFASTFKFPFDEVKVKLRKSFQEIDFEDLKADKEILKKVSLSTYNYEINSDECKEILSKTNGWITGVHILLQSYLKKIDAQEGMSISENMEYFFEKEILNAIPTAYRDTVVLSSVFESFSEEILKYLFKSTNVVEAVEILKIKFGFIIKKSNDQSYEYITFFKDFLRKKMKERYDSDFLRKFFLKVASYYKKENNIDEQVKYLLKSEDFINIMPGLITALQIFIKRSDYHIINEILHKIPSELYDKYPVLFYFKGMTYRDYLGNTSDASDYFNKCIKSKRRISEHYYIKSVCAKAVILLFNGEGNAANSILTKPALKKTGINNLPYVFSNLVLLNFYVGNFSKAVKNSEKALDILKNRKDWEAERLKYSIFTILGNVFAVQGQYTKALNYYEQSIKNSLSDYNKVISMVNVYYALVCLGDFNLLDDVYLKIKTHKLLIELPQIKSMLDEMELLKHFETGLNHEALEKADEIIELAKKINSPKLAQNALITKCKIYFYTSDFIMLKNFISQIINSKINLTASDKIKIDLFTYSITSNLSKVKGCLKSFEGAESFEDLIFGLFRTAEVLISLKKQAESIEVLEKIFMMTKEKEYYNCAIKEYLFKREIYDFAFKHRLQVKFIHNLQGEILKRKNLISNFEVFYDVKLLLFGVPRLYVRGNKIDSMLWKRKKFFLMFIFIIINDHTHITKDILIEEFFPEGDKEYTDNIFHQFLSNMRSILRVHSSENNPELVSYSNKNFEVNTDYVISSDYKEFFETLKKVESLKNTNPSKEKLLSEMIELSDKEFMKSYYESWIEDLRETVNLKRMKCINMLIELIKTENNNLDLIRFYETLLKNDSLNYEQFLELLKLYIEIGESRQAKTKFLACSEIFKHEIESDPSNKSLNYIKQKLESIV